MLLLGDAASRVHTQRYVDYIKALSKDSSKGVHRWVGGNRRGFFGWWPERGWGTTLPSISLSPFQPVFPRCMHPTAATPAYLPPPIHLPDSPLPAHLLCTHVHLHPHSLTGIPQGG
jgi:hypothetical protein